MPVEIKGLIETRRLLAKYAPDVKKDMDRKARTHLKFMTSAAKGYAPMSLDHDLHNWQTGQSAKKVNSYTSAFATRSFPLYQASLVKAGIGYTTKVNRINSRGFASQYRIENKTAAGAIYETAGRVNPDGLPWVGPTASPGNRKVSHSRNKNAGKWFIDSLDANDNQRQIKGKKEGRLIFRAVEDDNGRFRKDVIQAVNEAGKRVQAQLDAIQAFGGTAWR